ncbi:hypothetical protein NX779_02965 [Mycoplasma cottewii]|uniref:Uncharacterized protein n=1 Tax=Mycoplasma cottewii TaxID=51364 RepID=A0ABY5TYS0_9MOLU|nr:hypothetical protein [Mycoplasma cottewii]UWD34751.1 hypothetical protein NX779_02965 [Mycoplasma cottewii]
MLLQPFSFLTAFFTREQYITFLQNYWYILVLAIPMIVWFLLSIIIFAISFIKLWKTTITRLDIKKEVCINQIKNIIKDNKSVTNFYKLEILYKNKKSSSIYINSGFEMWVREYEKKLTRSVVYSKISGKRTDEDFYDMIGSQLFEFIDYFTRRIIFLKNRKLVKFENYSILVNESKQITFDEIGEYLINNYLYHIDKNIRKILPEQE